MSQRARALELEGSRALEYYQRRYIHAVLACSTGTCTAGREIGSPAAVSGIRKQQPRESDAGYLGYYHNNEWVPRCTAARISNQLLLYTNTVGVEAASPSSAHPKWHLPLPWHPIDALQSISNLLTYARTSHDSVSRAQVGKERKKKKRSQNDRRHRSRRPPGRFLFSRGAGTKRMRQPSNQPWPDEGISVEIYHSQL